MKIILFTFNKSQEFALKRQLKIKWEDLELIAIHFATCKSTEFIDWRDCRTNFEINSRGTPGSASIYFTWFVLLHG